MPERARFCGLAVVTPTTDVTRSATSSKVIMQVDVPSEDDQYEMIDYHLTALDLPTCIGTRARPDHSDDGVESDESWEQQSDELVEQEPTELQTKSRDRVNRSRSPVKNWEQALTDGPDSESLLETWSRTGSTRRGKKILGRLKKKDRKAKKLDREKIETDINAEAVLNIDDKIDHRDFLSHPLVDKITSEKLAA